MHVILLSRMHPFKSCPDFWVEIQYLVIQIVNFIGQAQAQNMMYLWILVLNFHF